MGVLLACIYVHPVCGLVPSEVRRYLITPESGVRDGVSFHVLSIKTWSSDRAVSAP